MKHFYITFRSVTFAQQGEKLLTGNHIRCQLLRTPRWMEVQGCGYCLKIHTDDILRAVELLRSREIPLRKVYHQTEYGTLEEMKI